MISDFNQLEDLFEEINKNLDKKIHLFVIGGAMMLYYKMKETTKDIDLVVDDRSEFYIMQTLLKKLKFTTKIPNTEYKKVNISQILIRDDFRIDLFHKTICKGFQLSSAMMKRAEKVAEMKNLSVFICAPEDVSLLKTFTERDGDIEDCLKIASRKNLNWAAMLKEIRSQIKTSGSEIWITWIGERLDILEERGLEIPIMKEINK